MVQVLTRTRPVISLKLPATFAMAPHLSDLELHTCEKMNRQGKTPSQILSTLQSIRRRKGLEGPGSTAVYDFLKGSTHDRNADENRGRPGVLTQRHLVVLNAVRKRLQKEAENEYHVTWGDIQEEGLKELRKKGLWGKRTPMVSTTYLALKFKEKFGVQKRRSRARIARTESEVQRRWNKAITWGKRPASWWEGQEDGENGIHCYIDNKSFVAPLTEEQKKLQRQVRVTHHLRTAEEGGQNEYLVPRGGRNLPGLPTFAVTAAVAHDKIIFWRAVPAGGWSAQKAADMYADLKKALVKKYGARSFFRVVEDGDRVGYQSKKGKDAKKKLGLVSWTLPPRTPQWMPLDFSLWHEVEQKVLAKDVKGKESKKAYSARVRKTALKLPASVIKKCLASMKKRIKATEEAKGKYTSMD